MILHACATLLLRWQPMHRKTAIIEVQTIEVTATHRSPGCRYLLLLRCFVLLLRLGLFPLSLVRTTLTRGATRINYHAVSFY